MKNLKVFGAEIIDEKCITQIKNCFSENDLAVLTADAHYGYGHPSGNVPVLGAVRAKKAPIFD